MPKNEKLTARQGEVLLMIKAYIKKYGIAPSRLDISSEMGFASPNSAEEYVKILERKWYLERLPGVSRGLRLTEKGKRFKQ